MKQFISFIKKEFYHITRDSLTLVIMLILPVVMLLILGFAVSTELKNTSFVVLDESKSSASQQFINKLANNPYFSLSGYLNTSKEAEASFQEGKCKMVVTIPSHFGDDLLRTDNAQVQVMVDASDPNEASTMVAYMELIVMQYQQEQATTIGVNSVNPEVKMLYNPQMKSAYSFVPGLIGLIMMLICAMMTSISVVREKELGTMEILLVSPLHPTAIILAKAIPYLIVSLLDVVLILFISYYLLGVPIAGNLALLMLLSFIFTFSALSLGLLISSITEIQQAAMIASSVGLMLPSMLLSGMLFPIESMPKLLQIISNIIPARWFIESIRDIMIKGLGFTAIWKEFAVLLLMTIFLLIASIKNFKNRL